MLDRLEAIQESPVADGTSQAADVFLPCPFCGSRHVTHDPDVARCTSCGARAGQAVWQRRAQPLDVAKGLSTIDRLASRISGNPLANEIDRANASGILQIVRRLND